MWHAQSTLVTMAVFVSVNFAIIMNQENSCYKEFAVISSAVVTRAHHLCTFISKAKAVSC